MLSSPTNWLRASPIEILITRACDPSFSEPNYAIHLEVAEYINNKKANNPREAAMLIARYANHRNPSVAILALALLETLVQSCGYPFHLQISTKEFLNELVRRFPERPPPFPGPVMSRILDLIRSWKEGICVDSRWKEDLGNIRDMHRLLSFKGYRFRDLPRQQNLASASRDLKSAAELESEDREAQSAKLQELIRRGTPRDLAAAQEIMKSLAGADPEAKPDYRSQALQELGKLEQKVVLMNEMFDNVDTERGERFVQGDAYDQVATILKNARPKIQNWISDAETDDPESLDTFLQINDQINNVLSRYESYKKGDYAAAANPIPKELSAGGGGLSLIDFDDSSSSQPANAPGGGGSNVDELAALFNSLGPPSQSQSQTTPTTMQLPATSSSNAAQMSPMSMPFKNVGNVGNNGQIAQFQPQQPHNQIMLPRSNTSTPNYFHSGPPNPQGPVVGLGLGGGLGLGAGTGGMGGMGAGMGAGLRGNAGSAFGAGNQRPMVPQQQNQQQTQPPSTTQGKDPFADLAGLF